METRKDIPIRRTHFSKINKDFYYFDLKSKSRLEVLNLPF